MSNTGQYANGDRYELPADWIPLGGAVLNEILHRAQIAVDGDAVDRLKMFYNPKGEYAGRSFLDAWPNEPGSVLAADLYAVSRLSIRVTNLQGRMLLEDNAVRGRTEQLLAAIPPELTISNLTPEVLTDMWNLQSHFRALLATTGKQSNHWVFAAKLCARKRPALFPVRDSVVCGYLSGGQRLAASAKHAQQGRLGWFSSDIQVFAFLATDKALRASLHELQDKAETGAIGVDTEPLRLLDVLLWTKGKGLGRLSTDER